MLRLRALHAPCARVLRQCVMVERCAPSRLLSATTICAPSPARPAGFIAPHAARLHTRSALQQAAASPSTTGAVPITDAPDVSALPSQQHRWDTLRQLADRLLKQPPQPDHASGASASQLQPEWIVLPSLRAQASPHASLHAAARTLEEEERSIEEQQREQQAEGNSDASLDPQRRLVSTQQLSPMLHEQPLLLQPHVGAMWRRLHRWDQSFQRRAAERLQSSSSSPAAALGVDAESAPLPLGWPTRGLFLDGPNGSSKSTSLYALSCLGRAQGWMVVHVASGEEWLSALQTGTATRHFVQAIYEGAAACALPSTAQWSAPHSLLQLPLDARLEYTSTLIEQGISSFGELLTLALELSDGTEEAELALECIMAQLHALQEQVPVLLAIDGMDALTQRCLQRPGSDADADADAEDEPELLAPINTSPFYYVNFHRAPVFRGGFVVSGESFALLQQSQPELMERVSSVQGGEDAEEEEEGEGGEGATASSSSNPSTSTSSIAGAATDVSPIVVWPLPPLPNAAWCRAFLQQRARSDPALAASFLLDGQLDSTVWSAIYNQLTGGHYSMLNLLLQLPAVKGGNINVSTLRTEFTSLCSHTSLSLFAGLFPDLPRQLAERRALAGFFLRHLPAGRYRDFLRNDGRVGGGGRIGPRKEGEDGGGAGHARDYNLVALNEVDSRSMVEWIRRYVVAAAHGSSGPDHVAPMSNKQLQALVADSEAFGMLAANLPWEQLSTAQLRLVQHSKVEAFLQLLAQGLLMRNGQPIALTLLRGEDASNSPASVTLPVASVNHWSSSLDPAILDPVTDLSAQSLQCQWALTGAIVEASEECHIKPAEHMTRLVHVTRDAEGQHTQLTLLLPVLDPQLLRMLLDLPAAAQQSAASATSSPVSDAAATVAAADIPSSSSPSTSATVATSVTSHASSAPATAAPSPLLHTLHLHVLSELVQALQICVGPAAVVQVRTQDGRLFGWEQLERMVECTQQSDASADAADLPLLGTRVTGIVATPLPGGSQQPRTMPSLRVIVTSSQRGPSSAAPSLHPLFAFADALLGPQLADMLALKPEQLAAVRWR